MISHKCLIRLQFFAMIAFVCVSLLFVQNVLAASKVTVQLSWAAPTTHCDGAALASPPQIAGYRIYASVTPIPDNVDPAAPCVVSPVTGATLIADETTLPFGTVLATVEYMPPVNVGTVFIRASAVSTTGDESGLGNEVSKAFVLIVRTSPLIITIIP